MAAQRRAVLKLGPHNVKQPQNLEQLILHQLRQNHHDRVLKQRNVVKHRRLVLKPL